MSNVKIVPGTGGNQYVPYDARTGNESIVYFTRDISPEGIRKIYQRVKANLVGKIAVKCHTGEPMGPNIIPPAWVKEFFENEIQDGAIVETNTYYDGDRFTTEQHRETLKKNGWDKWTTVDIMDEDGVDNYPVEGGRWFETIGVGSHMKNYDSLLALTHFKGHVQGGFGGSNKNIGIGCADGRVGKAQIHSHDANASGKFVFDTLEEELMEKISESTKGTIGHFGKHVSYINVMRNMSVSCDCEGIGAQPVVTPDVGILASLDILAIDSACVDIVYSLADKDNKDLIERMTSRHGLRQLSYMKEMGMGNDKYVLIDIDNGDVRIDAAKAAEAAHPFAGSNQYD